MALISIVVPVYNVEKYFHKCIDSICCQTFSDFELIIIDDGSSDDSPAICDSYADIDSRIHVFHQANQGLSAARNKGIEWALTHSDSRYITFVDSDDYVHPQYLELLYHAMLNSGCMIVVGDMKKTRDDVDFTQAPYSMVRVMSPYDLLCENATSYTVAWGKLYLKSEFSELRYPVGMLHEDEFVTWKIMLKYRQIAKVDFPIYYYRQRDDSITGGRWNPKRVKCLYALQEQLNWIDMNGTDKAKLRLRKKILDVCVQQIKLIKKDGSYPEQEYFVRNRLQEYIHQFGKNYPFYVYPGIYATAWPKYSFLYWGLWYIYRIVNKAKKAMSGFMQQKNGNT